MPCIFTSFIKIHKSLVEGIFNQVSLALIQVLPEGKKKINDKEKADHTEA